MALALAIAWIVEWFAWQSQPRAPFWERREARMPISAPPVAAEPVLDPALPPAAQRTGRDPMERALDSRPEPPEGPIEEVASVALFEPEHGDEIPPVDDFPSPVTETPPVEPSAPGSDLEQASEPEPASEAPSPGARPEGEDEAAEPPPAPVEAPAALPRRSWLRVAIRRAEPAPEREGEREARLPVPMPEHEPGAGLPDAPPRVAEEASESVESTRERETAAPESPVAAAPPPRIVPSPLPPPAAPIPAPERPQVVRMRSRRHEPREWNLWELESLARVEVRREPARGEEWSYLFLHLRQFADTKGTLPTEFDGLVREAFWELLEALEPV